MNQGFQKIKLIYYTDPVCSTCWTFEPYLFKFLKCYDAFVEVEYRMGGLLEDWDTLPRFDKRKSNDVFLRELWDSESERFQIGIDSGIWNRGGIQSSYPCCISYYAALAQGKEKADKFLRKLREILFIRGKDPSIESSLVTCAIESEVDLKSFLISMRSGVAEEQFKSHLISKSSDHVKHFPSFILENGHGESRKILNITDYQFFNEVVDRLDQYMTELTDSSIFKKKKHVSAIQLLQRFNYLSFIQLATISELDHEAIAHEIDLVLKNGSVICEWHNGFAHYKINETPYHLKRRPSDERFAIIGGGICGNFLKLALDQVNVRSEIYEKHKTAGERGFGFLILQNGIEALDSIGLKNAFMKRGNHMNFFKAVKPDGTILFQKDLENCVAISRDDLLELFKDQVPESDIHYGKEFRKFQSDPHKKLLFDDGSSCEADIYVGVDGIRSAVRTELFGEQALVDVGEREIVCMVDAGAFSFRLDEFYKVVDTEGGKSIGIIPLANNKYIWFLQFNQHIDPFDSNDSDDKRDFVWQMITHFPEKVKDLVSQSDFNRSFLWVSQRMDHLPSYFKENSVLLGDAAHPLLPLTSQGANSALEDAATLAMVWSEYSGDLDVPAILKKYDSMRRAIIAHYIEDGDALAEDFMLLSTNKKFKLPLTIH